jgi:fungal STAND N-terminal Goodbye domain
MPTTDSTDTVLYAARTIYAVTILGAQMSAPRSSHHMLHSQFRSQSNRALNPHHSIPSGRKFADNLWPFMSSTGQATSSTSSNSNVQLITNALADYTKVTGVDLSKCPFAAAIEQSNSPEVILELLQERENAFKEYRDNNRRLINYLSPAVKVIQAFSGILGEAVTLVSHKCYQVTFLS